VILLHRLLSIFRALFRPKETEQALDDEMQSYIEMSAAEKMRDGISYGEARRLAVLQLGGAEQAKERVRSNRHGAMLEEFISDLKYAFRIIARNQGFTAVIVLTLGLGIGANTAIFSLVNAVMLKSLPVHEPERLAEVVAGTTGDGYRNSFSNPVWEQIRDRDIFDGAIAYSARQYDLSSGGETRFVNGLQVNAGYFQVLGVNPIAGRAFNPSDDRRGCGEDGPAAMLSYAFWQSHFGGADVLGKTIALNGRAFTIIGVSPPYFSGVRVGESFDVVTPLCAHGDIDNSNRIWLMVMGRLKPGSTVVEAEAKLRSLQPAIREATLPLEANPKFAKTYDVNFAKDYLKDPFRLTPAAFGSSDLRKDYAQALLVLSVIAGLVLFVACGNVATLLLARTTARIKEIAVRVSIGASRPRLIRQLLVESLTLSICGAAFGYIAAPAASRLIVYGLSGSSTRVFLDVSPDWRVLSFAVALALATGLFFGIVPAVRAARWAPAETLREMAGSAGTSQRSGRMGRRLVSVQMALSLMLVLGATLFVRSYHRLAVENHGFDPSRILLVETGVSTAVNYGVEGALPHSDDSPLYSRLVEAVDAVPGVQSAAYSFAVPVGGSVFHTLVQADGFEPQSDRDSDVNYNEVSPGYFKTLGTSLLAGRDFDFHDKPDSPIAIVNEAFARKFLSGRNSVGSVIRVIDAGKWAPTEVVGLVQDAKYTSLRSSPPATIYQVAPPHVSAGWVLSIRTAENPANFAQAAAQAIGAVDKTLPITMRTFQSQVSDAMAQERLLATLSAFFGVLGLLIAGVGLAGLTSYSITRRRAEMGIRSALGATSASLVRMMMRDVLAMIAVGLVPGAVLGVAAGRFLGGMLYKVRGDDPLTLGIAAAALAAAAAIAGYIPARRAARISPMECLRSN
jgi:predicted permease